MLVRAFGATLQGVRGVPVSVEVAAAAGGLPNFQIVGQGDRVVSESRDRIRAAFSQCKLPFPPGRVTVNLVPTELPKSGPSLDLPIAIGLAAIKLEIPAARLHSTLLVGELGLDGDLHPVRGALALVDACSLAELEQAIVPEASLAEASIHPLVDVRGAVDLAGAVGFLRGEHELPREARASPLLPLREPDLSEVRGQESARRALEIAAAGSHNVLLIGPPGSGKTLLARRLPGLLPDLPASWALEATRIHGVAGVLRGRSLLMRPPFRAPHHTTSDVGLIGGGKPTRPGEISLAHRGVLFLDELPEFRRSTLEALRQPIEEGSVRIVRSHGAFEIDARFQLVAAMNPCPCGYRGDPIRECSCDDGMVRRYRAKLSGPLLDRIDLQVPVPRVDWSSVRGTDTESTVTVRERVARARGRQRLRSPSQPWLPNAELPAERCRQLPLDADAAALLDRASERLGLTLRGCIRALRVARTIADLGPDAPLDAPLSARQLAEALSFRGL